MGDRSKRKSDRKSDGGKTYWDKLKSFLGDLLLKIFGKSAKTTAWIKDILGMKENEKEWRKVFTHFTFDPENNYERNEFIGDTICKPTFCMYLLDAYDVDFNEKQLTELNNVYMAKIEQEKMARSLGFQRFLRVPEENESSTARLLTDLFESFMGTLYYTSERAKVGLGFLACKGFISYIFGEDGLNWDIDLAKGDGSGKTNIDQLTLILRTPKVIEDEEVVGGLYDFMIILTSEHVKALAKYGKVLPKGYKLNNQGELVIGTGRGNTQKRASNEAYEEAYYEFLREKMGINIEWMDEVRSKIDLAQPYLEPYREKLIEKIQKQGLENVHFVIPPKLSNNKTAFIQLVGIRKGKGVVLASTTTTAVDGSFYEQEKIELVNKYLK